MNNEKIGLTEANFKLFASKHYCNTFYEDDEFEEDLKRFAYLKRLFNIYRNSGDLKINLITNHLVIIYNVWPHAAAPMLFLKLKNYESLLKTFLIYMNRMPDNLNGIGIEQRNINSCDIETDYKILEELKKNVAK